MDILFMNKKIFFRFVEACNEQYRFGHDLELYRKIIEKHREVNDIFRLISDRDGFLSLIIDTLRAWNMDQRGAELASLDDFQKSVETLRDEFVELYKYKIFSIKREETEKVVERLDKAFDKLKIMKSRSKIVGVSKTLHFLLPDLIMPMDRKYTFPFFKKSFNNIPQEKKVFKDIFRRTREISRGLCLNQCDVSGKKWNTSVPKLIDNAIIGLFKYGETHSTEELKSVLKETVA